jgi:hypothetical protein
MLCSIVSIVIPLSASVDCSSFLAGLAEEIHRSDIEVAARQHVKRLLSLVRALNEKGRVSSQGPGLPFDASCQALRTLAAWRPFGPLVTSNSTLSPSARLLKPWA